jgi:hypothetical protein
VIRGLFDGIPLPWVLAASVVAFLGASELGRAIGTRVRARRAAESDPELGTTIGGLLGLLGLLLAFTFGMAGARFDARKTLVVEEANAIGTAWLRTDLVSEPHRAEARRALRAYVQARLDATTVGRRDAAIATSERLHEELWRATVAAARESPTPPVALFVASVNEVIDMHGRRLNAALRNPIPASIFAALYLVSLLVLAALGYARGLTDDRARAATVVLTVVLVVTMGLIMDLDRPYEGLLTVSQQAMLDVQKSMGTAP